MTQTRDYVYRRLTGEFVIGRGGRASHGQVKISGTGLAPF